MLVKSYSISPACHGKSFAPAFFFLRSLLISYLITLSLEKYIIVLEKVSNFGSKICANPERKGNSSPSVHVLRKRFTSSGS